MSVQIELIAKAVEDINRLGTSKIAAKLEEVSGGEWTIKPLDNVNALIGRQKDGRTVVVIPTDDGVTSRVRISRYTEDANGLCIPDTQIDIKVGRQFLRPAVNDLLLGSTHEERSTMIMEEVFFVLGKLTAYLEIAAREEDLNKMF